MWTGDRGQGTGWMPVGRPIPEAASAALIGGSKRRPGVLQSFRELTVWQKAIQLAEIVCRFTKEFPREEIFGLASQMRRSAVSIPSNIAEGHGRFGAREYRNFLSIARGSNCELQTQLEIARRLGYGDPRLLSEAEALSHEVGKMIFTIARKVPSTRRS
jgi:four helix bundle protein